LRRTKKEIESAEPNFAGESAAYKANDTHFISMALSDSDGINIGNF